MAEKTSPVPADPQEYGIFLSVSKKQIAPLLKAIAKNPKLKHLHKDLKERLENIKDPLWWRYIGQARSQGRDGEVETDHNAVVSYSEDSGAYVMSWLWIDAKALRVCRKCGHTRLTHQHYLGDNEALQCTGCGHEMIFENDEIEPIAEPNKLTDTLKEP